MTDKAEIIKEATDTLSKLFDKYHDSGLVSVHLWGSIITHDFNTKTSDIDAVGIISDEADFNELVKIREWLPYANDKIVRLQIRFYYLSELTGDKLAVKRQYYPSTSNQAAYDFSNWLYVCGQKIEPNKMKSVSPQTFLKDQIEIVKERTLWAKNPTTGLGSYQYCKAVIWLCVAIHGLTSEYKGFSWQCLISEANDDTEPIINKLRMLKESGWDSELVGSELPFFYDNVELLIKKYE